MNRKLYLLLLAALLVAASSAPALAASPRTARTAELPGTQYFTMVGFVTAKGNNSISVEVVHGNRFSQPLVGTIKVVQVNLTTTEFRRWTPIGCVPITWEEVTVGDTVSVHGGVEGDVFNASRVTVDVPLSCCTS